MEGTYWYHSHNAIQRMDGLFGAIIIYGKETTAQPQDEIVLVMSDWFNVDSVELVASDPYNFAGTDRFTGTAFYHCRDEHKAFQHGVKVTIVHELNLLIHYKLTGVEFVHGLVNRQRSWSIPEPFQRNGCICLIPASIHNSQRAKKAETSKYSRRPRISIAFRSTGWSRDDNHRVRWCEHNSN